MPAIVPGRFTVESSRPLVVFLIGARINKWWLLPFALPILSRMTRMLRELSNDPNSGFLGVQNFGFGAVQYWRSVEDLLAYAENRELTHKPTAVRYFQKLFRGASAGIWHELYAVSAGHYETLYVNMPPYGLGSVRPLVPASGPLATSRGRLTAWLEPKAAEVA